MQFLEKNGRKIAILSEQNFTVTRYLLIGKREQYQVVLYLTKKLFYEGQADILTSVKRDVTKLNNILLGHFMEEEFFFPLDQFLLQKIQLKPVQVVRFDELEDYFYSLYGLAFQWSLIRFFSERFVYDQSSHITHFDSCRTHQVRS